MDNGTNDRPPAGDAQPGNVVPMRRVFRARLDNLIESGERKPFFDLWLYCSSDQSTSDFFGDAGIGTKQSLKELRALKFFDSDGRLSIDKKDLLAIMHKEPALTEMALGNLMGHTKEALLYAYAHVLDGKTASFEGLSAKNELADMGWVARWRNYQATPETQGLEPYSGELMPLPLPFYESVFAYAQDNQTNYQQAIAAVEAARTNKLTKSGLLLPKPNAGASPNVINALFTPKASPMRHLKPADVYYLPAKKGSEPDESEESYYKRMGFYLAEFDTAVLLVLLNRPEIISLDDVPEPLRKALFTSQAVKNTAGHFVGVMRPDGVFTPEAQAVLRQWAEERGVLLSEKIFKEDKSGSEKKGELIEFDTSPPSNSGKTAGATGSRSGDVVPLHVEIPGDEDPAPENDKWAGPDEDTFHDLTDAQKMALAHFEFPEVKGALLSIPPDLRPYLLTHNQQGIFYLRQVIADLVDDFIKQQHDEFSLNAGQEVMLGIYKSLLEAADIHYARYGLSHDDVTSAFADIEPLSIDVIIDYVPSHWLCVVTEPGRDTRPVVTLSPKIKQLMMRHGLRYCLVKYAGLSLEELPEGLNDLDCGYGEWI